jgi:hypothetical protein
LKLPPDNRLRPRLNVYVAGFLSGMIGSKGDLKQGMLGALTAGFMHPMKAGIAHGVTGPTT